jgi:V/A-type H+-transporting ATPase subunit I
MAIAEMQKTRMAVHRSVADELIDKIQRLGCCQFIPNSAEKTDESALIPLRQRMRRLDDQLADARFVLRFLEPFATEKGGGMAKALGDAPEYSLAELAAMASGEKFARTVGETRALEKKLADARAGVSRVSGLISQLSALSALPYPLDFYGRGTEKIAGALVSLLASNQGALESSLADALGEMAEIFVLPAEEKSESRTLSILYPRELSEAFQNALGVVQTARVDVPSGLTGIPADEASTLGIELAEVRKREAEAAAEITTTANEYYRLCQCCTDYWSIERAKLESLISGEQTEQITLLAFWIQRDRLDDFKKAVSPWENLVEIVLVNPDEDENPPTLLLNSGMVVPVEPLIEMYGTPAYSGFDPSAVVAPFFYAFFGICFGDAGYGLLIASLLIALMKKKHVTGTLRKFLQILIIGNICALIFGALTFSWFGDSITSFSFLGFLMPLEKLKILDPMNDPMTMLGVSLAFGFVQIMVGLALAMRENLRKGDKVAAFADQGGWILFLCGLVLYGLSSTGSIPVPANLSGAIAAIGALVLLTTQGRSKPSLFGKIFSGVMSLYNVTSYLGDLLSYSRLLALGLGSAAVGMVINMLANLVAESAPGIGILFGILIFVLGHVFSIAVNILGAFVHSLRLQYVEFFGKFYESSGEEFVPLSISTQHVKISG